MNRNKRRIGVLAGFGLIVVLGLCFLTTGRAALAEEEKEEVLYSNDFEEKDDISSTPSTNTECKINFKGLTDEKAHSGKKSLKIDFTVNGGHFCFWRSRLNIPLTEDITFSGYLFRSEGRYVASLTVGIFYPKAIKTKEGKYKLMTGQCRVPAVSGISPGRWCQFFADSKNLYEHAKNFALKQGWDDTDMYIGYWHVHITGGPYWKQKEERIVVYVDDISINREEAEEEIY